MLRGNTRSRNEPRELSFDLLSRFLGEKVIQVQSGGMHSQENVDRPESMTVSPLRSSPTTRFHSSDTQIVRIRPALCHPLLHQAFLMCC